MARHKIEKFSVDDALDSIDLSFSNYVPSDEAFEFFAMMRVFFGEDFEIPSPKFHYFMVDMLFGKVEQKDFPYSEEVNNIIRINPSRIGILASRGSSKSTVVTLFYPIYIAIKGWSPVTGKSSHILILSDSQKGGSRDQCLIMGNAFTRSKFANDWFEKIRFTESEVELVRSGDEPVEKRHMLIKFKGASGGGIRSGSRNPVTGDRYSHIMADDIIKNEADAGSEVIMGKINTAISSDALNAMRAKNTQMVLINTPFHTKDIIYSSVESGVFTPLVVPICKRIDEDITVEEFEPLWEEMHDYYSIMERYLNAKGANTLRSFNQELMLRVASEEDRLIPEELIQWYDRELVMKILSGYTLYITTDFTTTSETHSDFSGIALWAVSYNSDFFLLDLSLKRCGIQEQYNELFRMLMFWGRGGRNIEVGIENDGQQKAHIFALKEMMQKRNVYFNLARQKGAPVTKEGITVNGLGQKHERFRASIPHWQNRKIWFPNQLKSTPDMKEALKQIRRTTYFKFADHDDFPDLVTMMTSLIEYMIPSEDYSEGGTAEKVHSGSSIWDSFDMEEEENATKSTIF